MELIGKLLELFDDWVAWECEWIMTGHCWRERYPTLNQELIDKYVDLQTTRNILAEEMEKVKTHNGIWGTDFPIGTEWDGGLSLDGGKRCSIRRNQDGSYTVYVRFLRNQPYSLDIGDFNDEREAKKFCLAIVESWRKQTEETKQ